MDGLSLRVVRRYRVATRPVHIDKGEIKSFVTNSLVPDILRWMKHRRPDDEPLGSLDGIAEGTIEIEDASGKFPIVITVYIHSLAAKGKWAAVLRGSSSAKATYSNGAYRANVNLWINGALSPKEWLDEDPMKGGRFEPLHSCTHDRCLPFGLYSLLTHELTHAAESVFNHPDPAYYRYGPEKQEVTDEIAYLNDPLEVRAWMQQIVDDVLRTFKNPIITNHVKDPRRILDMALRMSTTWGVVQEKLTPQNRNKILKAVHDALVREGLLG